MRMRGPADGVSMNTILTYFTQTVVHALGAAMGREAWEGTVRSARQANVTAVGSEHLRCSFLEIHQHGRIDNEHLPLEVQG